MYSNIGDTGFINPHTIRMKKELSFLLIRMLQELPLTYLGYFFLFLGILLSIFNPRSRFRGLMKRASAVATLLVILILQSKFSANQLNRNPFHPPLQVTLPKSGCRDTTDE